MFLQIFIFSLVVIIGKHKYRVLNYLFVIIEPMKILFVLECANQPTNGTTSSCIRFAKELEKKGHEVYIIGCDRIVGEAYHRYYPLPKYHFPFADKAIIKDGFIFVKLIYEKLYEAIKDKDVVHTFLPFKLANMCRLIAEEQGIAVTGAFHTVPQNYTAAIHLGWSKLINNIILYCCQKYYYENIRYIHCPSMMAADIMKKHKFKNAVPRVISNGVIPYYQKLDNVKKPDELKDKFIVCMSGRLADEKRQDLIIKAVSKSKYNKDIQVILCGQGPNKDFYYRLAKKKKLANPIIIKYCKADELRDTLNYIDLYIHASDFEIEGISCMEAITCGAVPLISNHPFCATKEFALDKDRCLFKAGSVKDLKEKIEWFYENKDKHDELKKLYKDNVDKYSLKHSLDEFEQMLIDAYNEQKEGRSLHQLSPRKKDKRLLKRIHRDMNRQIKHPKRVEKYYKSSPSK